jgi:hypothetical protein
VLRLLDVFNALPYSFSVDISAEFQPGNIAQLALVGNSVVCTVSNGLSPCGIIDDVKVRAFTSNSWDETVIAPVSAANTTFNSQNQLVCANDIHMELVNPNILPSSFVSIPVPCQLIPRNGVVVFPAQTPLNYDLIGSGVPNAIKTLVRYTYQVPNIIGDNSTSGNHRVTVWMCRGLFATDVFETNQTYPLNSNLFVSELGFLTTRQPYPNSPCCAICIGPPSAVDSMLQFMWL